MSDYKEKFSFAVAGLVLLAQQAHAGSDLNAEEYKSMVFSKAEQECVDVYGNVMTDSVRTIGCMKLLTQEQIRLSEYHRFNNDGIGIELKQELRASCGPSSLRYIDGKARILGWQAALQSNPAHAITSNYQCSIALEKASPAFNKEARDLLRDLSACARHENDDGCKHADKELDYFTGRLSTFEL